MSTQPDTPVARGESAPGSLEPIEAQPRRFTTPSEYAEMDRRRQRVVLLAVRTLFLVMLVTVSLLPFVGTITEGQTEASFWFYAVPFFAMFVFGVGVVLIDAATSPAMMPA
jgi:hypothetical protein